jgi:hypothetical protein
MAKKPTANSSTKKQDAAMASRAAASTTSGKQDAAMASRRTTSTTVAKNTNTKKTTAPKVTTKPQDVQAKIDSLKQLEEKIKRKIGANDAVDVVEEEKEEDKPLEITKDTRDAYALLEEAFRLYGLESLVPVIRGYMEQDLGPEQAKLKLKSEKAYKDRFKGNELLLAKGLNVIDEASYLELENDYGTTLTAYGLSDYFGVATNAATRLSRQQKMAEVIGNGISADEFKTRISTVVTRVNNSDANTKTALRALYNITDTDLVKYFLDPKEGSVQLKDKVTAAEISGASMTQGLGQTSLGTAEELVKLGIDKAEALAGYSNIASYLPTAEKLGSIYAAEGITYNKATGEEEEFKGLASAKRKREKLISREIGTFSGSSGTSQASLRSKSAGQI